MVETGRDRASAGEREREGELVGDGRCGKGWSAPKMGENRLEMGGNRRRKWGEIFEERERGEIFGGNGLCSSDPRFCLPGFKFSLKKLHATWKGTEKRRIKVSRIEGLKKGK